jgi:hypothetical protein
VFEKERELLQDWVGQLRSDLDVYDQSLSGVYEPAEVIASIERLIGLTQAAEPKDDKQEREHCGRVASKLSGWTDEQCELQDALMRERTAVRAPLQAEIERLKAQCDLYFEEVNQEPLRTVRMLRAQLATLRSVTTRLLSALEGVVFEETVSWEAAAEASDAVRAVRDALEASK